MASDEAFRAKKLPDHLLKELLDKVDASESSQKRNRRKSDRLSYRKRDLALQITHPGGGLISCEVAARNLSPTGISFLYWNYLHTGTNCTIHLKRHLSGTVPAEGVVMWCRHLVGPHHLVGLHFHERISQSLFVDPKELENADSKETIDPASLAGRLLHVESQQVEQLLFRTMLSETGMEVVAVSDAQAACAELGKGKFDLIVTEYDLPGTTANKAIPLFRQAGHSGRILCCTSETEPSILLSLRLCGANAIIQKPLIEQRLMAFIRSLLVVETVPPSERIFSQFAGQPEMEQLIESYVAQTRAMLEALSQEIQFDHFAAARRIISRVKGSAGSHGFATLSAAALDAMKSLDATSSIAKAACQLQQVHDIGRRISTGTAENAGK